MSNRTTEKNRNYMRKYRETQDRSLEHKKSAYYIFHYGITIDDYQRMFDEQSGRCLICGIHQSEVSRSLCVDHDHKTGKVRGLLCTRCNTLLGLADDNKNTLKAAMRYLSRAGY